MLERLYVRPELAAFEAALRVEVERLLAFEDERFARPRQVDHDPATGELTLVSEFVAGSRLADLLETAQDAGFAPGVAVALGFLLEALPALSTFHSKTGMTHGLIDPSRTVVTAAGQIVFLDCPFGATIERLGLSTARLWNELGIAAPPSAGRVRLDATSDVAQVALSAVMVVLGRRLQPHEFPEALPSLLMEIIEVAQISRSSTFASALQRILQRSLPLPGRRPFGTPDEVIVEVRQLVRREIGLDACRQALVDFVAQMDAMSLGETEVDAPLSPADVFDQAMLEAGIHLVDDVDEDADAVQEEAGDADDDEGEDELELDLSFGEQSVRPAPARPAAEETTAEPDVVEIDDMYVLDDQSHDEVPSFTAARDADIEAPAPTSAYTQSDESWETESASAQAPEPSRRETWADPDPAPEPVGDRNPGAGAIEPPPIAVAASVAAAQAWAAPASTVDRAESVPAAPPEPATPPSTFDAPVVRGAEQPVDTVPEIPPAAVMAEETEAPWAPEPVPGPVDPPAAPTPLETTAATPEADAAESASSRRRKRQQRSARARKDKLRSHTTDQSIGGAKPAPPPAPAPAAKAGAWIVSPDRAAAFEAVRPDAAAAASTPARPLVVPPAPTFPPPPPTPALAAATPVMPVYNPPPPAPAVPMPVMPVFNAPSPIPLKPKPAVPATPAAVRPAAAAAGPLRVKADPPSGYAPVRKRLAPDPPPDERAFNHAPFSSMAEEEAPRSFPWKLASAAVIIIAIAVLVGRAYIPSRSAPPAQDAPELAPVAAAEPPPSTPSTTAGEIVIETQPAGARVLLDGKLVGESPMKLPAVPPGKHVITFVTSSGDFKRSVRVVAGKTLTLDVPLYSGWVAIFAPIMLDVAENGRTIGNTEQNRLLLPPGPHKLTLSNRELGYTTVKEVEIQAGEVYSVTIDPRGPVNFNAVPWAEVWLDNQKIGDTPIANFQVPLGVRELVFKHPQFGERRVTKTIRAGDAIAVSVDFTKP